jgi:hypothetical protein
MNAWNILATKPGLSEKRTLWSRDKRSTGSLSRRPRSFTMDGEAVVTGADGVAVFCALHRRHKARLCAHAGPLGRRGSYRRILVTEEIRRRRLELAI